MRNAACSRKSGRCESPVRTGPDSRATTTTGEDQAITSVPTPGARGAIGFGVIASHEARCVPSPSWLLVGLGPGGASVTPA